MKVKILCEDQMHEVFVRRALLNLGFHRRDFLASAVASKTESGTDMCRQKQLRQPAPASLQSACDEYHRLSQ